MFSKTLQYRVLFCFKIPKIDFLNFLFKVGMNGIKNKLSIEFKS